MFIVLQPDNDILGVYDTLEKAIERADNCAFHFWGWIEEWDINADEQRGARIDEFDIADIKNSKNSIKICH